MYEIEIEFSPVYELITSLYTYLDPTGMKITDLSNTWVKEVNKTLEPWLIDELREKKLEVLHRLNLLVWRCPGDKSIRHFIDWLEQSSHHDIYAYLTPWVESIPMDSLQVHKQIVKLLKCWHNQYFSRFDENMIKLLEQDAEHKKSIVNHMDPISFVEYCTNGIRIEAADIQRVILVPQYHFSPFSITDFYNGVVTCLYPVEINTENLISRRLIRQAKSLADMKRVEILKFLQQGPKTFMEIHKFSGLVKSNLHYHLSLLRTSGLIRAHHTSQRVSGYSLREEELSRMHKGFASYIKGDNQ